MKKLIETMHTIRELLKDVSILGIYGSDGCVVHLSKAVFLEVFEEYEVVTRESDTYPFEFVTRCGDIKFFCVVEER